MSKRATRTRNSRLSVADMVPGWSDMREDERTIVYRAWQDSGYKYLAADEITRLIEHLRPIHLDDLPDEQHINS
jgi:hypothetical protein